MTIKKNNSYVIFFFSSEISFIVKILDDLYYVNALSGF